MLHFAAGVPFRQDVIFDFRVGIFPILFFQWHYLRCCLFCGDICGVTVQATDAGRRKFGGQGRSLSSECPLPNLRWPRGQTTNFA